MAKESRTVVHFKNPLIGFPIQQSTNGITHGVLVEDELDSAPAGMLPVVIQHGNKKQHTILVFVPLSTVRVAIPMTMEVPRTGDAAQEETEQPVNPTTGIVEEGTANQGTIPEATDTGAEGAFAEQSVPAATSVRGGPKPAGRRSSRKKGR